MDRFPRFGSQIEATIYGAGLPDETWGFPLTIRLITAGDTGDTAIERAESAARQGSVLAVYTAG
jgi:hypothetical protein